MLSSRPAARRLRLETLADARAAQAALEHFRQARPYWDRCTEMLLVAARTGRKDDVAEATRCHGRVGEENWLK